MAEIMKLKELDKGIEIIAARVGEYDGNLENEKQYQGKDFLSMWEIIKSLGQANSWTAEYMDKTNGEKKSYEELNNENTDLHRIIRLLLSTNIVFLGKRYKTRMGTGYEIGSELDDPNIKLLAKIQENPNKRVKKEEFKLQDTEALKRDLAVKLDIPGLLTAFEKVWDVGKERELNELYNRIDGDFSAFTSAIRDLIESCLDTNKKFTKDLDPIKKKIDEYTKNIEIYIDDNDIQNVRDGKSVDESTKKLTEYYDDLHAVNNVISKLIQIKEENIEQQPREISDIEAKERLPETNWCWNGEGIFERGEKKEKITISYEKMTGDNKNFMKELIIAFKKKKISESIIDSIKPIRKLLEKIKNNNLTNRMKDLTEECERNKSDCETTVEELQQKFEEKILPEENALQHPSLKEKTKNVSKGAWDTVKGLFTSKKEEHQNGKEDSNDKNKTVKEKPGKKEPKQTKNDKLEKQKSENTDNKEKTTVDGVPDDSKKNTGGLKSVFGGLFGKSKDKNENPKVTMNEEPKKIKETKQQEKKGKFFWF